jgi:hypothetical protein
MCIMHSPTTGIWYYVHVPFRSLKFWFITGRTILHPVWHPFFLSLRTACKLWREWTHATDPTSDMNWPVQIFYVVLTVSLAVKSSSSASHNQGPRLVANHHSMRRSAGGGAPANHHSMRRSAAHHSMRRSAVRVEPSQHAPECGGRGRAWTVIADTAIPSVHHVMIPWTPSPCHWHNEEIHRRGLFAFMTPTVCAPTCIFLWFPRLFCLHFAKFACHNMYKCVIKVIIV